MKYKLTEAILSNGTRELLWFEITKMLIAQFKKKIIAPFIIIFGTLSCVSVAEISPRRSTGCRKVVCPAISDAPLSAFRA